MPGGNVAMSRKRNRPGQGSPRLLALCSLLLLTMGLALGPPRASAAPGWELILDRPGPDFRGIDFVSESEGWLVAGAGLLHTTDGGATGEEAAPISGLDVDFADASHGWLVGYDGSIYGTADGATWSRQESGTNVHLSDVFAVSEQEAWAVGSGEGFSDVAGPFTPTALLHTADGGATWEQIETPRGASFRVITFVGQHGWVLGSCSSFPPPEPAEVPDCGSNRIALLHTEDGGATWGLLDNDLPARFFRDLVFVDETRGWAIASSGGMFATSDGGLTWQPAIDAPLSSFEAVSFRDGLQGWAIARRGCGRDSCSLALFSTADGGANWTSKPIGIDLRRGLELTLLATDQGLYLASTGVDFQVPGLAVRSVDDGASWQPMAHPTLDLRVLEFADRQVGYAIGGDVLFRTDDAGRSWRRLGPAPGGTRFGAIGFRDADRGFVTGSDCSQDQCVLKISATKDGGQSWETVFSAPIGFSAFPRAFQFVDPDHGWLAVEGGFLITHNGGRTWTQQQVPFDHAFVRDADLADKDHAWAVISWPERLIRSLDGGQTWQAAPGTGGTGRPQQVDFVDKNYGWYTANVCGERVCRALLFATQDGGETWEEIDLGDLTIIEELAFVDRLNGWLIGGSCEEQCTVEVLRTADGGRTWVGQLVITRYPRNFAFVDEETAWLWYPATHSVGFGAEVPARMLIYHTADAGGAPSSIVPPDTGVGLFESGGNAALPLALTLAALGMAMLATAILDPRQRHHS